jgi:ectoine hydroxylase-related dioxygenase (phytanoyl-CoA dioxygenase family)
VLNRQSIAGKFEYLRDVAYEYLRYVVRTGSKDPVSMVRSLPRWVVLSCVPALARSRAGSRALSSTEVDEAVRSFRRDGFVVLSDGLSEDETAALRHLVETKAEEVARLEAAGELRGRNPWRHPKRYSFGDYGPSPEWAYLSSNEPVLAVLRSIWRGRDFAVLTTGGDVVMPGAPEQELHSDLLWDGAGDDVPPVLIVDYYVSEVRLECGPIRYVPGTSRFPPPSRVSRRFEPSWMRRSKITGKPGFALIRDPRGWHGGTSNTSSEPRYMPDVCYMRRDEPLDRVAARYKVSALDRVEWIAEFHNS